MYITYIDEDIKRYKELLKMNNYKTVTLMSIINRTPIITYHEMKDTLKEAINQHKEFIKKAKEIT